MMPEKTINPELRARVKARELEEKENLTLAEKLILKSAQRTMGMSYEGIEFEILIPNSEEFSRMDYLNTSLAKGTSEDAEKDSDELCSVLSSLFIDDSVTPEVLKSGALGPSFVMHILLEVMGHEQDKAKEKTRFANFRKK